jgi:3-(3-hydroxy-phenyl)propionate hydroxylase
MGHPANRHTAGGVHAWTEMRVPTIRIGEPELVRWLQRKKAAAVVVRPDGFIYAAAESGQPLPAPPAIIPIRTGASA